MKPFSSWSSQNDATYSLKKVVAFDLDDTLTSHGSLPASVIAELERVQSAGWLTILVTGRPAGWADALIKLLPFDGVVAENGALLLYWPARKAKRGEREEAAKLFWQASGYGAHPPEGIRARHSEAASKILAAIPRAKVASDQAYRLYDLAIDFAEEVDPPLGIGDAQKIADLFARLGATAKVSSIHVNGWWGNFSKVDGLSTLLKSFGFAPEKNVIYVGDSPNDEPLFRCAALSVGVANVRAFAGTAGFGGPEYVTTGERSQGALEVLKALR